MVAVQGKDPASLKNISVKRGDEIYVQIDGNDHTGLDLTISDKDNTWDLAKDFSDVKNPAGAWAYGEVVVGGSGKPALKLFTIRNEEFGPDDLGTGQPAWAYSSPPNDSWYWSMMKSRGKVPLRRWVRFISDLTVYKEELINECWAGRFWGTNGRWELAYAGLQEREAFQIAIDKEMLSNGWQCLSASELAKTDRGARHLVVTLRNTTRPIDVKVHTVLDGTPIITRWLEITNRSEKSVALTAVYPWSSIMLTAKTFWGNSNPPKLFDTAFDLGYFTKSNHCWEGWFDWKPLPVGQTVIGCDRGQCYDDPFFVLRNNGTGEYMIGSLAWSANWTMELDHKSEGLHSLHFKIGPWATDALRVIAPRETISTPAVHMGMVSGDLDSAVQAMHDHVRRSVLPRRKPERSYLVQYSLPGDQGFLSKRFGDPSGYTEESVIKNIDLAASLGVELFIMDAAWWDVQGDWLASTTRFPRGLDHIVDYCHKKGMLFGIYGEIEKASSSSKTGKEHPDWIEWHKPYPVLNLARPEVASHMEKELSGLIERCKLDLFRLDFNTPTDSRFEGQSFDRGGVVENNFWRYYDAFYGIFERIHKRYPDLILQQAACGGGRNDLGMAVRFHEQYLTDGLRVPYEVQNYCGQTLSLPPEVLTIAHGGDAGQGIGCAEDLDTVLRVTFTLSTPFLFAGNVGRSEQEMHPARRARFLHYCNLYKTFIRPILPTSKVYHHAPVSSQSGVESSGWFAMEYAAPDRTKAWATIIRIGTNDSDTYSFKPGARQIRGRTYVRHESG
ncbi:MAG: alpha-galactosidase [Armatimonadetes bacterium]|nr:alpha-galactosidase [Armatimonadota bacterium]